MTASIVTMFTEQSTGKNVKGKVQDLILGTILVYGWRSGENVETLS
jgi:hypothetical protein